MRKLYKIIEDLAHFILPVILFCCKIKQGVIKFHFSSFRSFSIWIFQIKYWVKKNQFRFGKASIGLIILFFSLNPLQAQDKRLIELSGMVVTERGDEPVGLGFAEIQIKGSHRGVYANEKGFFSIAAQIQDTIEFRYLGYVPATYIIPDSLGSDHYTIFQIMVKDEILLPQTVIYPWPRKEFFKQDFLAMDVHESLAEIAKKNLAEENIKRLMNRTSYDAQASTSYFLTKQATSYYYYGQLQPMNILSPLAWIKFFEAWKRGDFKKKKKK
ncbi:MAG TPA: carboxypeptidase-like regulatory domain-containing protein [Saprospiraceae bacterium]|nr:carboxypeptidase-like regulatory domain-containing protein [Saprospiraceae bacterium]